MKWFIKAPLSLFVLASVAAGLTGCNVRNPCADLAPPTEQQMAVAAAGAEVEIEVSDNVDCELVNGRWERET